ncbi:hypothetical protein CYMTET_26514 [Cymbomonas tetramitiformis]|uniref:AB hydrolase-1 domain-containing protein n=1 Tax=Cymbomonas tetramitiformis TaxID=36881 RepID=A0AAE0KXV3_9CHLO|nr:hypothetical protein CYMTET_26514 [Cymbomonas tetramitiformis]|eukprot:gene4489-5505_t
MVSGLDKFSVFQLQSEITRRSAYDECVPIKEKALPRGFVQRPGATIHYLTYGDKSKPCLFFIHGSEQNNAAWWRIIPTLTNEYFCISMSIRSWGQSFVDDDNVDAVDPSLFGGDALAIIDQEKLKSVSIICHSIGGVVAVRAAFEEPERVERIIFCNSFAGFGDGAGPLERSICDTLWNPSVFIFGSSAEAWKLIYHRRDSMAKELRKDMPWIDSDRMSLLGGDRALTSLAPSFREREPAMACLHDAISAQNVQFARLAVFKRINALWNNNLMVPPADFRAKFTGPVHFITSELDGIMPWEFAEYRAAQLGDNTTLKYFTGSGHSVNVENADEFNAHLRQYLQGQYKDPCKRKL